MKTLRNLAIAALVGIGLLAATAGCGSEGATPDPRPRKAQLSDFEEFTEQKVVLKDGRTVTCLVAYGYREPGISCDWPAAKP